MERQQLSPNSPEASLRRMTSELLVLAPLATRLIVFALAACSGIAVLAVSDDAWSAVAVTLGVAVVPFVVLAKRDTERTACLRLLIWRESRRGRLDRLQPSEMDDWNHAKAAVQEAIAAYQAGGHWRRPLVVGSTMIGDPSLGTPDRLRLWVTVYGLAIFSAAVVVIAAGALLVTSAYF